MLTGGRLTLEDSYAYAKFARLALASNDIDMRARPHSAEETQFLAGSVAGQSSGVTYASLERAGAVLLAGFEPQDESPIVFLRLRKAARSRGLAVYSIAALAGPGLALMSGTLLPTVPGEEAEVLGRLAGGSGLDEAGAAVAHALRQPGAVILAGERLAEVPGALSAAARLAQETGAKLAWVPRRAGERGAVEAGALPMVLPGGRPVADQAARAEVARAWGVASLPSEPGRDTAQILAATAAREIGALVIAGVDPADLPDPAAALDALEAAQFVVSLELRVSAVTDRADVVLPVAGRRREGRHVRELGGQAGLVRRRARRPRGVERPAGARRARGRDGRAPRAARRQRRPARAERAGARHHVQLPGNCISHPDARCVGRGRPSPRPAPAPCQPPGRPESSLPRNLA